MLPSMRLAGLAKISLGASQALALVPRNKLRGARSPHAAVGRALRPPLANPVQGRLVPAGTGMPAICAAREGCGGGQANSGSFAPRLKFGSRSSL
jgi:hypothetical protein